MTATARAVLVVRLRRAAAHAVPDSPDWSYDRGDRRVQRHADPLAHTVSA